VHATWDNVHTDYTAPVSRPGPSGLAATEGEWRSRMQEAPNGWLLAGNSTTQVLTSGGPIYLMHTTVALDAIRTSGQLFASTGCLLAALYCAPLTLEPGGLRPHNLGAHLLRTKPHTRTLVFEITPTAPMPPLGIDYLRAGAIHLDTYRQFRSYLTPVEDRQLRRAALAQIGSTSGFLRTVLAHATGSNQPAAHLLDQLSQAAPHLPFLGYLYFEVVSEYLMLYSTADHTKVLAGIGELNSVLTKQLAFAAADGMDQLFDLAKFSPNRQQLDDLVTRIDPQLAPGADTYVADRLSHLLAHLSLAPGVDAAQASMDWSDFDAAAQEWPGLMGQLVFRLMRVAPRYPQLYLAVEQHKAHGLWDYWNSKNVAVPFNGYMPKGEVGINTAYPALNLRAWTGLADTEGRLHIGEELDLTPVPRLADLSLTAMRRDSSGRATGHPRQSASV
jgi:hypothetical protein